MGPAEDESPAEDELLTEELLVNGSDAEVEALSVTSSSGAVTIRLQAYPHLCINVKDGSSWNKNDVNLARCNSRSLNQRFLVPPGGGSNGPIRWARFPHKCLDVRGGLKKNGVNVQLYDCNGGTNRNRRFALGHAGRIKWSPAASWLCFDGQPVSNSGGYLRMWKCSESFRHRQVFIVKKW